MLAAISLFAPTLLGLGFAATLLMPGFWSPGDDRDRPVRLAAAAALGLDLHYLGAMALDRPGLALLAAAGLAVAGWIGLLVLLKGGLARALAIGIGPALLLLALFLAAASHVLLRPLEADDARFIWFHHARLAYYFDGLGAIRDVDAEGGRIAQAYYPKLVAVLGAAAAHLAGFWNEYFPKAGLLALLLPPALACLAFWRERLTFLFLLLAFFAVPHEYMWTGMVDGYLALYAGFGSLFLALWLERRGLPDLVLALAFLGVAGGLKTEANLLLLSLVLAGLALAGSRRGARLREIGRSLGPSILLPAAVAFGGFVFWHVLRVVWQLESDLTFGPQAWERMFARLGDPEAVALILTRYLLLWRTLTCLIFAGGMLWLFRRWRAETPIGVPLLLGAAFLCFCGLLLVYLMTPHGLYYHLVTSADRVLMTPRALVFAAAALWLHRFEVAARRRAAA